jgi:tRNA dimethylallyltransferase
MSYQNAYNCVIVLGPTAVGKTSIGVRIAYATGGEIISADSRQVYKGLDIGSGKDLADYDISPTVHIPYHLIDITDLSREYSVFDYQNDFYRVFAGLLQGGILPVIVGGTGMYVDSIVRGYDFVPVPVNEQLRKECESKSFDELKAMLIAEKEPLHNTSDMTDRGRIIQALEIKKFMKSPECAELRKTLPPRSDVRPLVIGTTLARAVLRQRIAQRLHERIDAGMIEEVVRLHEEGASWERLERLGLEYRFVSEYLQKKIATKEELFEKLNLAIGQFAKRQETWFRGMEKKGVEIHWLPPDPDSNGRFSAAVDLMRAHGLFDC